MSDKPIIFSGPMVRAILDGRKTQTRRVWKAANDFGLSYAVDLGNGFWGDEEGEFRGRLPYQPADRLWVRETWGEDQVVRSGGRYARPDICYRADLREDFPSLSGAVTSAKLINEGMEAAVRRWRPSIHMPRWASRLTLYVTAVKVERLQEISAEDCISEGIDYEQHKCGCEICARTSQICPASSSSLIMEFGGLWNSINAKRPGCAWEDNPWIVAVTFTSKLGNIDSLPKELAA